MFVLLFCVQAHAPKECNNFRAKISTQFVPTSVLDGKLSEENLIVCTSYLNYNLKFVKL